MNCNDIEKRISAYIDGELSGEELTLFEQHLKNCTLCAIVVENIFENIAIFQNMPDLEPPPFLAQKILNRTAKTEKGFLGRLLQIFHLEVPMIPRLAGAVMILVFVLTVGYNVLTRAPSDFLEIQQGESDIVSLVDYNGNRLFTKAVQAYQGVEETYDSISCFLSSVTDFIESNYEHVKSAFKGKEEEKEKDKSEPKRMNQTRIIRSSLSKTA